MRLFLASLFCASSILAQDPVIKTTIRLVQISVIAKSHDQPAEGLTVDDFKVFVDGHQQKISFFSAVAASDHPTSAVLVAPNTFTNLMSAKGQAMNGVTVVLLDLENTKFNDRMYAQQQLIKYLLSIPPTDRVAVYVFNGRLRVLHDYTSSMEAFQQKLAASNGKLVSLVNADSGGAIDPSLDGAGFADFMSGGGGSVAERAFYLRNRVVGTLDVLKFIASHLAAVPGRKNLVWLSEAFPLSFGFERMSKFSDEFNDEMDASVRALSDANVAVYPVDARGLTTLPQFSASQSSATTRANRPPKPAAISGHNEVDSQMTMEELAHRTGGHAYYNTNDLAKAIHEAVADSALTYTLGFYPDDEKHNREFHKLKVEVSKPHINLSYRTGYLDLAEIPKDERTRNVQIHDALWSPLDATELGISVKLSQPVASASVLLGQSAPPASDALDVSVVLDPKGIQIEPGTDRYSGRVDILLIQFDKDGSPVDGKSNTPMQTVDMNMHQATYRKFLADGLNVKQMINLNPRASSLRVIVRDYGSGMIGSVTVPLNGGV